MTGRSAWLVALALAAAGVGCDGGNGDGKGKGSGTDPAGDDDDDTTAPTSPKVWVNEVMALNRAAYEVGGAFPDWIELYNPNSTDVDLAGWFVTDNIDDPEKHELLAGVVAPANGYLVLFADDDEELGTDHLNFKVSATLHEDVALFDPALERIDALEDLEILPRDGALERTVDGGPTLDIVGGGTPGASNE